MSLALLYLLMLKATVTSFNGPSSLPLLRDELVVKHRIISDRQLNAAVMAGRSSPGPMGIYVVSVGYQVRGASGAIAGFLAMITPAFLVIPLLRYAGRRAENPRVRKTFEAIVIASAGLLLAASEPLARDAITGMLPLAICGTSFLLLVLTKVETIWVILGGAAVGIVPVML